MAQNNWLGLLRFQLRKCHCNLFFSPSLTIFLHNNFFLIIAHFHAEHVCVFAMVSRHLILITSKVNVFEGIWLSFQVSRKEKKKKKVNIMVTELHRKNVSKIWAANIQNPDKSINTLFALPLPRPFSNEHCSGNKLTYLLPKSYQRLLCSYLSTANL